jgi:sugar phosphate isomerase/epimerase
MLMLLGVMNHPMRDPVAEIATIHARGFDFVDLTLEPSRARSSDVDVPRLRAALAETGLPAVGHTAYFLPIASPYDELREVALREIERCVDVFAALGITRISVHPDPRVPLHEPDYVVDRNIQSFQRLSAYAAAHGARLLFENLAGLFGRPDVIGRVLDAVPDLGLLLDVGHTNLGPRNNADEVLARIGPRLAHVHFSDNRGGDMDLHLPLGAGRIDWEWVVKLLKSHGYDDTITLEVFTTESEYLLISAAKLRRIWSST